MTDTEKTESASNRPATHDVIDAFLSLESTEHIYITYDDGYIVDWPRFKEYSMEGMSPEIMRRWATELMTFSKQLTAMADESG